MLALRTKIEHWKKRGDHRLDGILSQSKRAATIQCAAASHDDGVCRASTGNDDGGNQEPSCRSTSGNCHPTSGYANERRSSELWKLAYKNVEETSDWQKFREIVERETGTQLSLAFDAADPSERITGVVSHAQQLVESKAQTQNKTLGKFLDTALQILQVIQNPADSVAQLNTYASCGWGLVKFIASVATTDRAVKKEACERLPEVVRWIYRFQTWDVVYIRTEAMTSAKPLYDKALIELYTAAVSYQVAAVISVCSRMTRIKQSFAGLESSRAREALNDLKLKEKDWEAIRDIAGREITDNRLQDLENSIEEFRKASSAELQDVCNEVRVISCTAESQRRTQILDWLSPLRCEDVHREPKRRPLLHTTDWLMEHNDYISWNNDPNSTCLKLEGRPGSGKSCLVHAVINDQIARCTTDQERAQILYFYCDATDAEGKALIDDHEKILRSLVKQLAASNPSSLPEVLVGVYERHHPNRCLTEEQCLDMILSTSDPSIDIKIIVDGLDECEEAVQKNLTRSLHSLFARRPQKVRLLVACRDYVVLENILHILAPRTVNLVKHTHNAIRTMVECTVNEWRKDGDFCFQNAADSTDLAKRVIEKVAERAGGMFRYARVALNRLHACESPIILVRALDELSRLPELEDLYDVEWTLLARADQSQWKMEAIITALSFVIYGFSYCIRESLTKRAQIRNSHHILEACAFLVKTNLDEALSIRQLLAMCPSLLTASSLVSAEDGGAQTQDDLILRLDHFSVTEYLVNQHPQWFSPAAGHATIAKLCMRIFVELNIATDFEDHPPNALALYATMCWPDHLRLSRRSPVNGSESVSTDPILRAFLLDSACSPSFLQWTRLMKKCRQNIIKVHRGPLLHLGIGTFIEDVPYLDSVLEGSLQAGNLLVTQPPSSLFARLYVGFEITALENQHWDLRCSLEYQGTTVTPQTFAAMLGLVSAIDTLAARGCSPNERNDNGETSGHVLCDGFFCSERRAETPLATILLALVRAGLRLDLKNHAGNSCFFTLLMSPEFNSDIFAIFQEQGFDLYATEPDPTSSASDILQRPQESPLEFAIAHMGRSKDRKYRQTSLDALLSYYAKSWDVSARTKWLCLAVHHNDVKLVMLLVEKYGADPTLCDAEKLLPLQYALRNNAGRSRHAAPIIDYLAPLTMKPDWALRSWEGFDSRSSFEGVLRCCALPTVKLFVQHITFREEARAVWGPKPITTTLLYNRIHGAEIAEYLESLKFVNAGTSRVYRKWQLGEYHRYTADHIDWNLGYLGLKALDEDEVGEEEAADDEFFARLQADYFIREISVADLLRRRSLESTKGL